MAITATDILYKFSVVAAAGAIGDDLQLIWNVQVLVSPIDHTRIFLKLGRFHS